MASNSQSLVRNNMKCILFFSLLIAIQLVALLEKGHFVHSLGNSFKWATNRGGSTGPEGGSSRWLGSRSLGEAAARRRDDSRR